MVHWQLENTRRKGRMGGNGMKITEGYMPYLGYQTYYRIVGECKGDKRPILLLHGGPGSTHNYFEVLDCLAEEGRAVISYDQLGCGKSFVANRPDLWKQETWMNELISLREYLGLKELHILGQSWGGMMAIAYACDYQPEGVRSLILSSANPSSSLWASEQHRMIRFLPEELRQAIREAEERGEYTSDAYRQANDLFMLRHCAGKPDPNGPECLIREKVSGTESYEVAWGPSEFNPLGNLASFEYLEKMPQITQPTLITSGIDDLCTPVIAKAMYDAVPRSRWELFTGSRHAPFVEETEKYAEILNRWLAEHDTDR